MAGAAFASSLLLIASLVVLRVMRHVRERRLAARQARWRTALHLATVSPADADLPPIPRAEIADFLQLWSHLKESLRGEASENLSVALRAAGLEPEVRSLLDSGSMHLNLIGITALGHLHDASSWDALRRLAVEPNPAISFAAARALLRIAPRAGLELLLPEAIRRTDWSLARLGAALQEIGPAVASPPIVAMLRFPPSEGLERLLKLARFAYRERVVVTVREWLGTSRQPEVLAAALDFVEDAEDLPRVLGAARHPDWRVRMGAARALGRIGTSRELATLLVLLEDASWWVRYRAAASLLTLSGLEALEIEALHARARDAFAADMIAHVLAERRPP